MYLLQQGIAPDEFKTIFETSLRGGYFVLIEIAFVKSVFFCVICKAN
jgi:hypothetical protein